MQTKPARSTVANTLRAQPVRSQTASGLSKTQAEALLDWLEAHGCREREVTWEEGKGFTVSYAS